MYSVDTLRRDYPTVGTAHLLAWMVPGKAKTAGIERPVARLLSHRALRIANDQRATWRNRLADAEAYAFGRVTLGNATAQGALLLVWHSFL